MISDTIFPTSVPSPTLEKLGFDGVSSLFLPMVSANTCVEIDDKIVIHKIIETNDIILLIPFFMVLPLCLIYF